MTKYSNNYLILKKRIVLYSEIRQNFCNSVASHIGHMSAFFQHFCWPVSDYRCFYWSTAVFCAFLFVCIYTLWRFWLFISDLRHFWCLVSVFWRFWCSASVFWRCWSASVFRRFCWSASVFWRFCWSTSVFRCLHLSFFTICILIPVKKCMNFPPPQKKNYPRVKNIR